MKSSVARAGIPAFGASERIPLLPNLPTAAELGTPVDAANWFGLLGPARMPGEVATWIARVAAEALSTATVQQVFRVQAAVRWRARPRRCAPSSHPTESAGPFSCANSISAWSRQASPSAGRDGRVDGAPGMMRARTACQNGISLFSSSSRPGAEALRMCRADHGSPPPPAAR